MLSFSQVKVGAGSPLLSLQVIENVVFIETIISLLLRQLQSEERLTEGRARERERERESERERERILTRPHVWLPHYNKTFFLLFIMI